MVDIITALYKLDVSLLEPAVIVLGGSAVPILAGCHFRATADVDFAVYPDTYVATVVQQNPELSAIFDLRAPGVMGLLNDFEERLVTVPDLPYVNLVVKRLSLMDWVVSKLTSPKLEDVLNVKEVTLEMLLDIRKHMHDYAGVGEYRAAQDLEYLIAEKE